MKYTLSGLLLFFCLFKATAQDTIIIYFGLNEASVSQSDKRLLHNLSVDYDLGAIDSALFIGYADSIGNVRSNLRLSERRATNAYRECKTFFREDISYRILARGENIRAENWQSRRVEIILFYHEDLETESEPVEIIKDVEPKCFLTDFEALQFCNVREFTKGRQTYVQIEAMNIPLFKERKHYYVLYDQKGKATVQRLNWKLKTTGRSWWEKKRWVATMPKTSFEKFQFFTLQEAPCSGCTETILTKDTLIATIPEYYPDLFLMDNMQRRIKFFGVNKITLRVPKEYVDLNTNYYIGSSPYSAQLNSPLQWEEKEGKRKQDFYFATHRVAMYESFYIKKMEYTTVCRNKYEYSGSYNGILCGGVKAHGSLAFCLIAEPGIFYHNDTITGFFALGTMWKGIELNAGMNHRSGFYAALNYDRQLFQFPLSSLRLTDRWENTNAPLQKIRYGRLFGGAEVRTSFTKSYQSFLEGNMHFGTRFFFFHNPYIYSELYMQGGYAYDFLRRINTTIYPYLEVGWKFRFVLG